MNPLNLAPRPNTTGRIMTCIRRWKRCVMPRLWPFVGRKASGLEEASNFNPLMPHPATEPHFLLPFHQILLCPNLVEVTFPTTPSLSDTISNQSPSAIQDLIVHLCHHPDSVHTFLCAKEMPPPEMYPGDRGHSRSDVMRHHQSLVDAPDGGYRAALRMFKVSVMSPCGRF
jgi:hypothetical protein